MIWSIACEWTLVGVVSEWGLSRVPCWPLELGFCQLSCSRVSSLNYYTAAISRWASLFPPSQPAWPWRWRKGWGLRYPPQNLLPPLQIPHTDGLLEGCCLMHVYDPGLCARLSCFIFLFLSNSGKTAGNNLMHMKRKWGVTNKIKLHLSTFLPVCKSTVLSTWDEQTQATIL